MVRFGIVSTNTISEWFAGACRATDGRAEAVAVCSRDVGRARAFAIGTPLFGAPLGRDDMQDALNGQKAA